MWAVQNEPTALHEFRISSGRPELLRSVELSGFVDTEAVAWVSGTTLAIVEENAAAINLCTVSADTTVLTRSIGACADPILLDGLSGAMPHNEGIEGLASVSGGGDVAFYAAREKNPMAIYAVSASGSITEPFNAQALWGSEIGDIAGLQYMPAAAGTVATLLVLSEDSNRVLQAVPSTGEVISTLEIDGATSMSQPEGEVRCLSSLPSAI